MLGKMIDAEVFKEFFKITIQSLPSFYLKAEYWYLGNSHPSHEVWLLYHNATLIWEMFTVVAASNVDQFRKINELA